MDFCSIEDAWDTSPLNASNEINDEIIYNSTKNNDSIVFPIQAQNKYANTSNDSHDNVREGYDTINFASSDTATFVNDAGTNKDISKLVKNPRTRKLLINELNKNRFQHMTYGLISEFSDIWHRNVIVRVREMDLTKETRETLIILLTVILIVILKR